ncbi:MAG TPA: metal ABC transporter permease [Thermoplasmatales archaeon]|nr:metal ABC transporter permease [Thermoplasmatales archaeon]
MFDLPLYLLIVSMVGAILAGLSCSTLGIFVVRLNIVSVGYCMSHAAFAGAAFGIMMGYDPLLFAILFSIGIAVLLGPLSDKAKLDSNVIIGVTFSLMIALAFIFLNFVPGVAATGAALSILWGSLFTIDINDILILFLITFLVLLFLILFYKELSAILFNRKLAEASGINTKLFLYTILFLTALTVSVSLKLIGGLLVFALIVNPTSTAYQLFFDFKKITVFSPLIGIASCLSGYVVSLESDFPLGASIVVVSSVIFAFSVIISPKRRKGRLLL